MMDPPCFRSYYSTAPPQNHRAPAKTRPRPAQTSPSQSRRVISIPVHFVDSAKNSAKKRDDAALKIQKTFRGFRVRKTVKKILELKREVDGVEKKLRERETVELVRRDGKERLKVNESLMALLFRLDSVRGFNSEIRAFRKAVIKKAIMLQELIDSVTVEADDRSMKESVGDDLENCEGMDDESVMTENVDNDVENCEGVDQNDGESMKDECDDSCNMCVDVSENFDGENLENSGVIEECGDQNVTGSLDNFGTMQVDDSEKNTTECEKLNNSDEIGDETLEKTENVISERATQGETVDGGEAWECVGKETEEPKSGCVQVGRKEASNDDWCVVGGGDREEDRKEKLLEKMAKDNERLMSLVADLCQKNTTQNRLISSLSQRVEQLEKAMSERLRKKKKKCTALHN